MTPQRLRLIDKAVEALKRLLGVSPTPPPPPCPRPVGRVWVKTIDGTVLASAEFDFLSGCDGLVLPIVTSGWPDVFEVEIPRLGAIPGYTMAVVIVPRGRGGPNTLEVDPRDFVAGGTFRLERLRLSPGTIWYSFPREA